MTEDSKINFETVVDGSEEALPINNSDGGKAKKSRSVSDAERRRRRQQRILGEAGNRLSKINYTHTSLGGEAAGSGGGHSTRTTPRTSRRSSPLPSGRSSPTKEDVFDSPFSRSRRNTGNFEGGGVSDSNNYFNTLQSTLSSSPDNINLSSFSTDNNNSSPAPHIRVGSDRAQIYIRSLQRTPKIPFSQLYARANPLALDLLEKLLKFDPSIRITVEQALAHPYLAAYHDEEDEPSHEKLFDFSFETVNSLEEMRGMIVQEVVSFKKSKQAVLTVNGAQLGRKPSLSAHERDSIMQPRQRQQQQQQNNYDSYAASQHGIIKPENMEVDEQLENELGGYINYQQ
ncbi:10386_t:CDS:2 [Entrophospora sp. SA101]|nr:10386_t:CDS:2 [Entrophospora sp. SA101]